MKEKLHTLLEKLKRPETAEGNHNKTRARTVLGVIVISGILLIVFFLLRSFVPFFMPSNKINRKTYKIYDEFDMGLAEVSKAFYSEEGYIERENIPKLFDAVEAELQKGIEDRTIDSYSREDDNNCILIRYRSGITEVFMPQEKDMLAGSGDSYITVMEPTSGYISTQFYGLATGLGILYADEHTDYDYPYTGLFGPDACAKMITDAYPKLYSYNDRSISIKNISSLLNSSFRKTGKFSGDKANLANIQNLEKAKVIIWEGHGGYTESLHSFLQVGQVESMGDFLKYKKDMKAGRLLLTNRELSLEYILGALDALTLKRHYVITSKYLDEYLDDMDDSLVFLGACESMHDDVLAQSFINKGADVVFGYTRETSMTYEMQTRAYVFYGMTAKQYSAGNAYNFAVDWWQKADPSGGYNAELAMLCSEDDMAYRYHLDGIRDTADAPISAAVQETAAQPDAGDSGTPEQTEENSGDSSDTRMVYLVMALIFFIIFWVLFRGLLNQDLNEMESPFMRFLFALFFGYLAYHCFKSFFDSFFGM